MRIVVSAPPKTGNHWIGCLLSTIYELQWPVEGAHAAASTPDTLADFVAAGNFPDDAMFHHHAKYTARLCNVIDAIPAHNVTLCRDPYDVFVSMYYWEQERSTRGLGRGQARPRHAMFGKPIDHQDVLDFLSNSFSAHINRAIGWQESRRALPIRYEELHQDPLAALTRITSAIEPVSEQTIQRALHACRADRVRQQDEKMAWHVRSAKVGDSRSKLTEAHLTIFRELHGDLIRQLGYEVR
jgi:hypothetical protein